MKGGKTETNHDSSIQKVMSLIPAQIHHLLFWRPIDGVLTQPLPVLSISSTSNISLVICEGCRSIITDCGKSGAQWPPHSYWVTAVNCQSFPHFFHIVGMFSETLVHASSTLTDVKMAASNLYQNNYFTSHCKIVHNSCWNLGVMLGCQDVFNISSALWRQIFIT